MAQQMRCDAPECSDLARILVTDTETGDVSAFCGGHFALFCAGVALESGLVQSLPDPGQPPQEAPAAASGKGGGGKAKRANNKAEESAEATEADPSSAGA